jgi:GNAT superfamily N-acetyltransferase
MTVPETAGVPAFRDGADLAARCVPGQADGRERAVPVVGELNPREHRAGVLALLGEIYPAVPPNLLAARLAVIQGSGWRCAGGFLDGALVALSGFWVQTRFYCGRYLYIDHFVVTGRRRSQRIGAQLLDFLHALAVVEGCEQTCLDTFITNEAAQRFWQREGYTAVGRHFVRPVAPGAAAGEEAR